MKIKFALAIAVSLLCSSVCLAQEMIISNFSTNYSYAGKQRSRAANIAQAASRINGVVLQPGQVFSYNDTVGPRTIENGFKKAHVIIKKHLVDGIGGGACQVSTTLHAAVLYSGLEITEVHPHSLASAYVKPTMDATVGYPYFDFKFKNTFDFPITIRMDTSKKGVLTATILGKRRPYRVEITINVLKKEKFNHVSWRSASIKTGTQHVVQPGSFGYDVERIVVVKNNAGFAVKTSLTSYHYEPSDRIVILPKL